MIARHRAPRVVLVVVLAVLLCVGFIAGEVIYQRATSHPHQSVVLHRSSGSPAVVPPTTAVSSHQSAAVPPSTAVSSPQSAVVPPAPRVGGSLLAQAKSSTPIDASPGRTSTGRNLPSVYEGAPLVVPVMAVYGDYVQVRLPWRPNGSTGWVSRTAVVESYTPYDIEVQTGAQRLVLYENGKPVFTAPVGVGTSVDPTPVGNFFIVGFQSPQSAEYGPFVIVTSAHSDAIQSWNGTGDAPIGIHGPLGAEDVIGTTGAAVSHGCVRLQLADLAHLRNVPDGTPVTIGQ